MSFQEHIIQKLLSPINDVRNNAEKQLHEAEEKHPDQVVTSLLQCLHSNAPEPVSLIAFLTV